MLMAIGVLPVPLAAKGKISNVKRCEHPPVRVWLKAHPGEVREGTLHKSS